MSPAWRRWRALRHHVLQRLLAAAAIAAAVALPVVLLSVGGGVAQHEIRSLQSAGYQVTVSAPGAHGIESVHAFAGAIGRLPHVAEVSPTLSVPIDAFPTGLSATPVLAEGVVPGPFGATLGPEDSGLFPHPLPFSDPTDAAFFANGSYDGPAAREMMVAGPLASAEGLSVGESLRLGPTSDGSGSVPFTIIGTFGTPEAAIGPTAAFAIILPLSELQALVGLGPGAGGPIDAADTVNVALAGASATDPSAVAQTAAAISALAPYYSVVALTAQAEQLGQSTAVLTGFYLALSSVGLAVGTIFLALVLVRQVETDRRTIGIRRAIGVPGRQVALEWLVVALRLTAVGVLAGVVGGWSIVAYLARFGTGEVATAARLALFDPIELALLALGVLALGAGASLLATRRALRLPIGEALR